MSETKKHYVKHKIDPDRVIFSMFTLEDLRKICQVKIVSPLTFDIMGHPLNGGLYDRAMGPLSDKGLPCGTCFKNVTNCPGHFGYIELPVPVVNPMFHKILQTVLKLTCLTCYRIQIPSYVKRLISVYMQLLDTGMITEAREMETVMYEIISENKDVLEVTEEQNKRIKKLEKMSNSIGTTPQQFILNKTTETLRNALIHDLLRVLKVKKCMHCKASIDRLQSFRNRIIVNVKKPLNSVENSDVSVMTSRAGDVRVMNAEESRTYLRKLWQNDRELLLELIPVLKRITKSDHPTDIFYFELVPVPPPICRPVNYVNAQIVEHPQTQVYKAVLQDSLVLRTIIHVVQGHDIRQLSAENQTVFEFAEGKTAIDKLHQMWQQLQNNVDCIMDKDLSIMRTSTQGLKQIMEKKEGIIRQHMMGKRVNYAARSVITPDPNLNIDEIGVPEAFAKHLTYPVVVTSWNVAEIRKMVLNGPDVHPGAKMVEFSDGKCSKISNSKAQKEAILKRLLTPSEDGEQKGVTTVYRHLINGDILLLNRQPTLHRPSIMAHTARILKDEKTIRLHYANCKAYNADFDGDEMNMHFPQSELARSEGYNLVNVSRQYLVPKDGTPLSGLIQDHMVAGVRLSIRGKFFNRQDYHQLVYQALGHSAGPIRIQPPAILKPIPLWSGKQLLSTVIINTIPRNRQPLNLKATAKISCKAWQNQKPREWRAGGSNFTYANQMTEAEVVIRQGELCTGVLDKTHYGATPYGLVHCMYELYGGQYATKLLSSFAKLFTCFLQQEGFTLGVHDILVKEKADKRRTKIISASRKVGHSASAAAVDLDPSVPPEVLHKKMEEASATNPKFRTIIDRAYKTALDSYTNDINKICLPAGLICPFPDNNLQLMVQSGAKGSTVNTMQISCLLGQIELEGKRPPVMISGKSLPSFIPFDTQPRAGGFIDGRFMTGILPQEFFFHCMAGREGLIDTAVKTSRSGYLQRCLVKHLEGLKVEYDLTVRDSDQSVIQFFYGEDGMDISKVQFLKQSQLAFLADNTKAIVDEGVLKDLKNVRNYSKLLKRMKKIHDWKKEFGDPLDKRRTSPFLKFSAIVRNKIDSEGTTGSAINKTTGRSDRTLKIIELWQNATPEIKTSFAGDCKPCPNPANADFQPDHFYGSLNDKIHELLDSYSGTDRDIFSDSLKLKAMQSLAVPGEPVGLLAAQSVGEPSTQMTLNTFHFAGRGEMNVTLGIPRLREILMMASPNIKTPSMEIPFKAVDNLETLAEDLRKSLTRVTISNVLEKVDVTIRLEIKPNRRHLYCLRFHFLPPELYLNEFNVRPKQIIRHMTRKFFDQLFMGVRKIAKLSSETNFDFNETNVDKSTKKKKAEDDLEDDPEPIEEAVDNDSEDEVPEGAEEDAKLSARFRAQNDDQEAAEDDEQLLSQSEDEDKPDLDEDAGTDEAFLKSHAFAQDYIYDKLSYLWCELTFGLPLNLKNVDLTALLRETAEKSVVSEVENIKRAITYKKDEKQLFLRTDGINVNEMFKYYNLLDLNKLYSNDIHKIAATYGIEAARRVIVKEVKDVFNVYGITVDPRHLLLIADYMTFNGSFEPLSRRGMDCNSSPLQQMSFESSLKFLRDASIRGKADALTSPSSCLMLGKLCRTGTGCFNLLQDIPSMI